MHGETFGAANHAVLIMIAAIAIGLFAGVFTMAFMQGAVDARIESATKSELAHLQVHAPRFLKIIILNIIFQFTGTAQPN